MGNRHAYLIMAHNDFDLLEDILEDLDHPDNDIFLHVDQKSREYPLEIMKSRINSAGFYPVSRMKVNWAGYSQIACELHLLSCALQQGKHAYYHLMTGATCPVLSQEKIHSYFDAHAGDQFIGYVKEGEFLHRVKFYNLFNEIGKPRNSVHDKLILIRDLWNAVQNRLHFYYGPSIGVDFRKGFAYWSLTQEAAEYILSQKNWIRRVFRHSICGDEVFAQTVLWNSPFKDQIHDADHEYGSCLRYVKPSQSWNDDFGTTSAGSSAPENGILPEDVKEIMDSGMLFALKFVGPTGIDAFHVLKSARK